MTTQDRANEVLGPFFPKLRSCIERGFQAWQELGRTNPDLRVPLKPRTRANFIYDHICSAAFAEFANAKGVRLTTNRGFLEIIVNREFVIRFKKLDHKGLSRNILTASQFKWFNGQETLFDMSVDTQRLIAGYVLDLLGIELQQVLVTCPNGVSSIEWKIALGPNENKVVKMPDATRKPKSPTVTSRQKKTDDKGKQ
jgi:hypothetical protein